MHRILFYIGVEPVYSYGVMRLLSMVIILFLITKNLCDVGWPKKFFFELAFWGILAGVVGARIFYASLSLKNLLPFLVLPDGAFSFEGAIWGGVITAVIFSKIKKISPLLILDFLSPFCALLESIMRIGCFLNGCCSGRPSQIFGLRFPQDPSPLFPVQIFLFLGLLLIYVVLRRHYKTRPQLGNIFIWYLLLRSSFYFFMEFLRSRYSPFFLFLDGFHMYYLVIILGSAVILAMRRRTAAA